MLRILTVDDEPPIQELYEAVLGLAGCELSGQAFDGERAVAMFLESDPRPDLIIMDYRMPVLDGLAATRAILSEDRRAQIVFISADGSVEKEAREAGAIAFLAKPFALADFIALLKRLSGGALSGPLARGQTEAQAAHR
jgi:two-component system chemotaxis response regulator CheY